MTRQPATAAREPLAHEASDRWLSFPVSLGAWGSSVVVDPEVSTVRPGLEALLLRGPVERARPAPSAPAAATP